MNSVIFNKLESGTSQKRAQITYKIYSGNNGNLMPFKVFRMVFPKSAIED